ncbi:hypothetical protein DL768_011749 [Monosporascus sp. mg162]|nr:hypothetical protein DL768_011749 [Monosporascus sp. mg162]
MAHNPETLSSGEAGSGDHQSPTPDILQEHFGQSPPGILFTDAATSHFYQDQPLQLPPTDDSTLLDLPADNTILNHQPFQLPVIDENTLDMISFDGDGSDALLHGPPLLPPMDGNTTFNMTPIDREALLYSLPLQLPEALDVMPVVDNVVRDQSSQPPVADNTALEVPPCTSFGQLFNPDPSSPTIFPDAPWSLPDHVFSTESFDRCLSAPLTTFSTSDLPHCLGQGFPATQSSAVVPAVSAHLPAATNQPLNELGSPRPAGQQEIRIYAPGSIPRKRSFDQAQCPIRPGKRLSSILPKTPPVQPSSAASMSTMTSNLPPKSDVKQANIPADMLRTFELKGLGISNPVDQRTRSKKHWLRKLYGGGDHFGEILMPSVVFFTLLSSMDLDPDLQFAPGGDVGEDETGSVNDNDPVGGDPVGEDPVDEDPVDEDPVDEDPVDEDDDEEDDEEDDDGEDDDADNDDEEYDDEEDDDEDDDDEDDDDEEDDGDNSDGNDLVPRPLTMACQMLAEIAERCRGTVNQQALNEKLDILACKDLADLFSSPLQLSVESDLKSLKKGAIIRYTKGVATLESRAFEHLIEMLGDDHPISQEEIIFYFFSGTWIE